jgi:glycosyltransferase involved in cell wall biosynthesis
MPKVGFVIRTKNEETWLRLVIKTLYKQTFKDFTITVIDSGSTDGTIRIIKSFPQIN